jgi:transcriptional regulator with XRE-family HTH domain
MKSRMEIICKLLGENVRASRLAMGISQEELAFRAELDRTYISQIERGVGNPSLGVLLKISNVLDTDIAALLSKQSKAA